jgi:hypothetical protein
MQCPIARSLRTAAGSALLLVLAVVLASGCGSKLLPIQPGVFPPPVVSDLDYDVQGDEIQLSWSVPRAKPETESEAASFKILRSRQTVEEAQCRECPPAFQLAGEVLAGERRFFSRLRFKDRLQPGFHYLYTVRAVSSDGMEGKDSKVISIAH